MNKIFKAYDIRGVYPSEINEEIPYKIGKALITYLKNNNQPHKTICIGKDARESGNKLFESLSKAITKMGSNVIDLGMISTDCLYFSVGFLDSDAGIMITASHNPGKYNGMKFCKKNVIPMDGEELEKLKQIIEIENYIENTNDSKGKIIKKDILDDYLNKVLSFIDLNNIKPLNIIVDAGNGVGGLIFEKLEQKLPLKIKSMYFKPDGTFPNHLANPIEPKNTEELRIKVKAKEADLGIAFDGDADRAFFVDENGKLIRSTLINALISKYMLKKFPNSKILYNVVTGWTVPKTIKKYNGIPVRSRVGHSYIKKIMREQNIVFGGEHSGHYYYKDFYFADSGLITAMIIIGILSKSDKPISEIIKEFDKFFAIDETNFEVEKKQEKIDELKEVYFDGEQDLIDGIRVDYDNWWFNVRASNTQPKLRLNLEANSKDLLDEKFKEIKKMILS